MTTPKRPTDARIVKDFQRFEESFNTCMALVREEPENFPRIEVSWEAEQLLKLIDNAIAHERKRITTALLSDGAVDALLTMTWGWYDYDKGLWYDDAPEAVKNGARDDERDGIRNMLDYIGLTEDES